MFLDRAGVDRASEQMVCWLVELGVPGRDALRIRLMMEELLLRICVHYGEGIDGTLRMGTHFGIPFIGFRYAGEAYDPTGEESDEMSRWTGQLLANMGLSPLLELLLNILPSNPIRPFSDGNTLQIIFLTVFLGVILLGMCCVDNNLEPTGFYGIMQMSLI